MPKQEPQIRRGRAGVVRIFVFRLRRRGAGSAQSSGFQKQRKPEPCDCAIGDFQEMVKGNYRQGQLFTDNECDLFWRSLAPDRHASRGHPRVGAERYRL